MSRSPCWLQIFFFNSLLFYLFTFAINLWHRKFVTADVTAVFISSQHGVQRRGQDFENNFICNFYGERVPILNTENVKICGWVTKLEVIKMIFLEFLPYLLNICIKFEVFISQGSVATYIRWDEHCRMDFVANFIGFLQCENFENRSKFDKVTESIMVGTFLRHSSTPKVGLS